MGTEIKTWQIINGKLAPIDTTLAKEDRKETPDLEPWIESNPEIVGTDIMIIGKQVPTSSGRIDLLGVDRSGNTVIIELKRGLLSRDVLAQAIDYASNVAEWKDGARLNDECLKHTHKDLDVAFNDAFNDAGQENITYNSTQRIIIVGFSIDTSLERMIGWLSDTYEVNINAVILSYVKTTGTEEHELLMKTSIISEEKIIEQIIKRGGKGGRFDNPGNYDEHELKQLLIEYLSIGQVTNQRIRKILLPALLKIDDPNKLTRDQLKYVFMSVPLNERGSTANDRNYDESKIGFYLTNISTQLSTEKNDFLRQIIAYEYPRRSWEKDNFSIRKPEGESLEVLGKEGYRNLIKEVLEIIEGKPREESKPQDLS